MSTTRIWIGALAALTVSTVSASAVTVTVDFVNANVNVNGSSDGDGSVPVATANATSTLTTEGTVDTIRGTALQNENGFSFLELTVDTNGYAGFAASGSTTRLENRATAIRGLTFTNDTGVVQQGTFSFSISGIRLETFHAGGGPIDPEAKVEFAVGATNGATYNANMTLRASYPQGGQLHEIVDSMNFAGSVVTSDCFQGYCQRGTVNVDALSDSISLGLLAPGDSVTVNTTFDIYTVFTATEIGAQARGQDPGSYSWSFTPAAGPGPSTVPLPAGAWLLLSGFGLAAALGRRKSS